MTRGSAAGVEPEATVPFETPPGHQGQVDFATFTLSLGWRNALLVVPCHSGMLWLRCTRGRPWRC